MPANVRESLVTGQWDFLGQLLDAKPQIEKVASTLPYLAGFSKS
jgi:3-isopropylmalate/(R)-2-methylmalate dehydratase small subunit